MEKFVFLMFICLFFSSCKITQHEEKIITKDNIYCSETQIPFEFKEHLPCFSVSDSKGTVYNFLFDSGYNFSGIFKSGLLKAGITKETEKVLRKSNMEITFSDEFYNPKQVFKYDSKNRFHKYADGIVGIDFFNAKKSLVLDYKNKCIVVDSEILEGDEIPMSKEFFNMYTIPVTINNVPQKALVDSGSEFFVLSEGYKVPETKTDKEKEAYIYDDQVKIKTVFDPGETIEINYGLHNERIKAFHYYNKLLKISSIGRRVCAEYCIFGYPMYKDKVIQFDFSNSNLIIRD